MLLSASALTAFLRPRQASWLINYLFYTYKCSIITKQINLPMLKACICRSCFHLDSICHSRTNNPVYGVSLHEIQLNALP